MAYYSENHNVESFVLWATNTGSVHEQHVALAKRDVPLGEWVEQVGTVLVPMYVRECHGATIRYSERREAALCLATYYADYVSEL